MRVSIPVLLATMLLAACGSDDESPAGGATNDAGHDTSGDVVTDAVADASPDGTVNSAQPDAAPDVEPDAPVDSAPDSVLDAASDGSGNAEMNGAVAPQWIELLDDNRFLNGFTTYSVQPSTTPVGELVPPTATESPSWQLQEWHTAQLLTIGPPTMTSWGAEWANAYKRVVVNDGFLELAINADAEYGGVYRQAGENWPHLLVAQDIYDSSKPTSNTPIHQYNSVSLSLDLELVYAEHIQEAGYNPGLHACQFLMYITLQNRNEAHPDFGNFIWFGLPFYDDRYATVDENVVIDAGTGKYMFRMASQNFMPASLHDVSSVSISVDLLPYMKAAVEDAIAQGILASTNLDDYYLGGMNMGYEVPGRSIATIRVRDLSMIGVR